MEECAFQCLCFAKWEKKIFVSLNIRHIHKITAFCHGLFFFFFFQICFRQIEFDEEVVVCVLFRNVENT